MGRKTVQAALILLGVLGITGLGSRDAIASDTVLLRYRGFGRAVPVADLTTLAETGTAPDSIDGLLKTANTEPTALQNILTRDLSVDTNLLNQVLYSWPGEWALDQLGEAIHPPAGQADRQALRAALILAADDDSKLNLMEVLQQYPTPQVVLEGDRIENAYAQLAALLGPLSSLYRQYGEL